MQFTVCRFHFHGFQSAFSQSQIGYAHKQKTCELAVHFNCTEHDISEINFIVINRKLSVRATQLTLIDCYLPGKSIGPHNYAHLLVLTVLTKGANSDLKIASAKILN